MMREFPETQQAVQLTGPNELRFNPAKPVPKPGPHQLLCRVEAAGLCFSDLKLLKDFDRHARKSEIISGIGPEVLAEIPSYVPGSAPTVPGHEAVVRVWAVGEQVTSCIPGDRRLVQTDYRWLRTASSNAAFGYDFEGALQEYVLMDERVITSPEGESMLLPVPEELSASALALVEPWACVEQAYLVRERRGFRTGGRMLLAGPAEPAAGALTETIRRYGEPAEIIWLSPHSMPSSFSARVERARSVGGIADGSCDDIICFGAGAELVEALFPKLAPGGLLVLALCGGVFARLVETPFGRVHYGGIRLVGTTGDDPTRAMEAIPASGEIRAGDRIGVIGAAGPMGVMHVVRDLCQGVEGVSVCALDLDGSRLEELKRLAEPLAAERGLGFAAVLSSRDNPSEALSYVVVMVPSSALVAQAVAEAAEGAIINVFAGMPPASTVATDLNAYVRKHVYAIGTSGSRVEDMRAVLAKLSSRALDTNLSVYAVAGLEGGEAGLRAVANREAGGKIIIYPSCQGLGLTPLAAMGERMPEVARHLSNGRWTAEAEAELLRQYGSEESD